MSNWVMSLSKSPSRGFNDGVASGIWCAPRHLRQPQIYLASCISQHSSGRTYDRYETMRPLFVPTISAALLFRHFDPKIHAPTARPFHAAIICSRSHTPSPYISPAISNRGFVKPPRHPIVHCAPALRRGRSRERQRRLRTCSRSPRSPDILPPAQSTTREDRSRLLAGDNLRSYLYIPLGEDLIGEYLPASWALHFSLPPAG